MRVLFWAALAACSLWHLSAANAGSEITAESTDEAAMTSGTLAKSIARGIDPDANITAVQFCQAGNLTVVRAQVPPSGGSRVKVIFTDGKFVISSGATDSQVEDTEKNGKCVSVSPNAFNDLPPLQP